MINMPVRGNTFKIFIGNLSEHATSQELRELFEPHGTVVEADAVKNYGFVHMQNEEEGKAAIVALNATKLHGKIIAVEASTGAKKVSNKRTKIFVGNLSKDTKFQDLQSLFETYGRVVEGDILSNYAFLHMDNEEAAMEAIRSLDGYELNGSRIRVQESTSRVRQQAGMGNPNMCYRCGSSGHWSKDCPRDSRFGGQRFSDRGERGRPYGNRYDPYGPPHPGYGRERGMRYRDDYDQYSQYDRYYDEPLYDRHYARPGPPPPPMAEDPYDRRLPPGHLPPLPPRSDYLRYARRSPPPRYPPPPPPISYGPGRPERRPY